MDQKIVTVIGGNGFLGRYVVRELAKRDYRVRVICRDINSAAYLKPYGDLGQITSIYGDLTKPDTVTRHIPGSYAVINLVGLLYETRKQRFRAIHANGAEKIAQACRAAHITRLVHISALGVNTAKNSRYARTKLLGENAVNTVLGTATVIRPSIMFGSDDNFFNKFARMSLISPFLPLIGGGKTRFQPVYVADVAEAIVNAMEMPEASGKVYELGGPRIYSFKQLLHYIMQQTGRKRLLLNLPFPLAKFMGLFTELLPVPPLTRDQVKLLKSNNTVAEDALTLDDLNVSPTAMELVVPDYLARYRRKPVSK